MALSIEPAVTVLEPAVTGDGRSTIALVTTEWDELGFPLRPAFTELVLRRLEDGTVVIVEADIFLDAARYVFVAGSPSAGELDLQSVLTHEVGHLLGLLHPCGDAGGPSCDSSEEFAASVMHPQYLRAGGDVGADDIAGLCAIYVSGTGCAMSCPEGRECEGDRCVDPACGEEVCEPACESVDGRCDVGRCEPDGSCSSGTCAVAGFNEGYCVPQGTTGAACERGEECESRLCLTSEREGSYCTTRCSDDADCGGMQRCADVDGAAVCAPLPPGGCAVTANPVDRPSAALWAALLVFPIRRRRSR